MATKYIPAWKDKKGNRLIFVAPNHVFDTEVEAREYQVTNFLFYIPFGVITGGIFEADVDDNGHAQFAHVACDAPFGGMCAIVEGPALDEALALECAP